MDDLARLQDALAATLVDVRDHLASGHVPEREVRTLVDLAEHAQGYLHDHARRLGTRPVRRRDGPGGAG